MAKTDPSCDSATIRDNFIMRDVSIHDNFVHHVGGEGFYIGNSFYTDGFQQDSCGFLLPHVLEGVRVFNNLTQHTGREGIQVGCAVEAKIFNNRVESYGELNLGGQNNGIQLGDGTSGLCHNNIIIGGKGSGIIALGIGNNTIFNNIVAKAGGYGIFCNDRNANNSFNLINNAIVDSKNGGIRFYSNGLLTNRVINNLIVNPGSYRNPNYQSEWDAFLFVRDTSNLIIRSNNLFITKIEHAKFRNAAQLNFDLGYRSPAADAGMDVSSYGITFDFLKRSRPLEFIYDIGAFESVSRR